MILRIKVKIALALGIPNLWRVIKYRLSVRLGLNKVKSLFTVIPLGDFFHMPKVSPKKKLDVNTQWNDRHCRFGWHSVEKATFPEWHLNPFTNRYISDPYKPWWDIPDFDPDFGDIKSVWEASRFDWIIAFTQRACQGDAASLLKLNTWLRDWIDNNPPYRGPNWKCGQEASIRVMHISMAALLLDQVTTPEPALHTLIHAHLKRIAPTIDYAIAQDNNHGTSEAAALFIGGSWLALHQKYQKEGKTWQHTGRRWLENRAGRLIAQDGSFSQYSVNYHRVMLDTFSMVEVWRRHLDLPCFSPLLYTRLSRAAEWLYNFTQPETGDTPNLGANDGARLLPLTDTDYRDYRPSVQLSMVLFNGCCAYPDNGTWHLPVQWLNIESPSQISGPKLKSIQFDDGGYSILRKNSAFALLRYPRFRFRPSQADALHVDFWLNGENLLRDGGTYSYSTSEANIRYFGGITSHNTIQFDDRDQMPQLSRFLLGEWLKSENVLPVTAEGEQIIAGAGYTDCQGVTHHRTVILTGERLKVEDRIKGFCKKAVLRWRLMPCCWVLKGNTLVHDDHTLTVSSNVPVHRMALLEGWESRYYLKKTRLPVMEVEIHSPGCLTTEYCFSS